MVHKLVSMKDRNAQIKTLYKKFQQTYQTSNMPDLYINWVQKPLGTAGLSIIDEDTITILAELRIEEVEWYLHELDIQAVLFHEFVHIWDMVEIRRNIRMESTFHTSLSEIHATYIEMKERLQLSAVEQITLQTIIPVLNKTQSIEEYLRSEHNDIRAFISEASLAHDENTIARIWKHIQYLCAKICCLHREFNIDIPVEFTHDLPADFYMPFMELANNIVDSSFMSVATNQNARKSVMLACQKLISLI